MVIGKEGSFQDVRGKSALLKFEIPWLELLRVQHSRDVSCARSSVWYLVRLNEITYRRTYLRRAGLSFG